MPYRTLAAPAVPRRSFRCWLRLCAMRADGSRGAMVCPRCGRTRTPRGDNERATLENAVDRYEASVDFARWSFEITEWERGGKAGPRPRGPIPAPGVLIEL
jgi:hypothetical protein